MVHFPPGVSIFFTLLLQYQNERDLYYSEKYNAMPQTRCIPSGHRNATLAAWRFWVTVPDVVTYGM
jgi:hypothetical protein